MSNQKSLNKNYNFIVNFYNKFPTSIIALSLVSFLMNLSTSIVSSTATNFVDDILKCDISFIVKIRSLAEGFSYFVKAFIGIFSDISKKRKLFLIIGYGGVLFIKPLFILVTFGFFSSSITSVIYGIAQIFDRLLNSIRDTPRDSLIADASPVHLKSQSFGLRRFFASIGSLGGGLLALTLTYFTISYSLIYTIATLPALYSVYILYKNVQEPKKTLEEEKENWFAWRNLLKNSNQLLKYILFIFIIFIMSFGKFNEFCLFQVAKDLGYSNSSSIGLYIFYYFFIALASYTLSLTKKKDNILLLIFSMGSLIMTNFLMGSFSNIITLLIATLFSSIYIGITESIICGAIITIFPTKNMRATLLGVLNTILGINMCITGYIVSYLSKTMSLQVIYLYGIIPPIVALILFIIYYKKIYQIN